MAKITKTKSNLDETAKSMLTGKMDHMYAKDRKKVIKTALNIAQKQTPNYEVLARELEGYEVELPSKPDMVDLPEINALYAMAQTYASRVSAIERLSISNLQQWSHVRNLVDDYISERTSELIVSEDIQKLPNVSSQQAAVHNKLKFYFRILREVKRREEWADAFRKCTENKRKDLSSIVMNLSRQVKVLAMEKSLGGN